jgi:tetratricopeptide (TPR) repeat protein
VRLRLLPFTSVGIVLLCLLGPIWAAGEEDAVRAITAALRAGRSQQALELARAARQESPKSVRVIVLEGMALSKLGKSAEALADFSAALELAPAYVPALEAAAEIEYREGRPAARAHLEHLLALRPDEPTAHAMLAALAWKRGDCDSAARHFAASRPAIDSNPGALHEYGACLMKLKRPEDASAIFRRLAELRPGDRRATYALAVALLDAKRARDASDSLAPLAAKSDPTALRLTSLAQESQGDTPQAVATLRQAILLDPRNADLYLDFAALSFTHQSFQVGVDVINAGLTQIPDSAPLYLARGVLLVQLGQYTKADADFDRAERLDPRQPVGSVVRGLSRVQQSNMDEALAALRSQLKTRPRDEFLYYVLAEVLSRQGAQPGSPEFQEALQAAETAVRLKPDFVLARDTLSRLYLENGDTAKAIAQCRQTLQYDPNDAMAIYRLMRALQSTGREKNAAEIAQLLKRFAAARDAARRQEEQESKFRLVEAGHEAVVEK